MDWKLIASTFGVIFLAELGDKTQLAAMTMSASSQKPLSVFIGASLALTAVSAVGVAVGAGCRSRADDVVRKVAAALFVLIGVAMLLDWISMRRRQRVRSWRRQSPQVLVERRRPAAATAPRSPSQEASATSTSSPLSAAR